MTRTNRTAGALTANHDDIRVQIRAFSLSKAEDPDREIIRALYRFFDERSDAFWAGALWPVPILISPPTSAQAYPNAAEFWGIGCRQQMRVRPSCARGAHNQEGSNDSPWWADTMLGEARMSFRHRGRV